jgi:hypothetical protein
MRHLVHSTFLLVILFISSGVAYPCSCAKPAFSEKLKTSKAIFAGEIVEVKPVKNGKNAIKFRVDRYWRGVKGSFMVVLSNAPRCIGISDRVGEKYLIFAKNYRGRLYTVTCMSPKLKDAQGELKRLGGGKNVLPTAPPTTH